MQNTLIGAVVMFWGHPYILGYATANSIITSRRMQQIVGQAFMSYYSNSNKGAVCTSMLHHCMQSHVAALLTPIYDSIA